MRIKGETILRTAITFIALVNAVLTMTGKNPLPYSEEELYAGRSVRNAVKNGFKNAFKAVLDSNVTTLIAVVVLSKFGTGTVQGFAITLGIGIVLSLITAVAFTHTFLNWMIHLGVKNPVAYGMKKGDVINA